MNKHEREFEEKNIDKKPQPTLKKKTKYIHIQEQLSLLSKTEGPLGVLGKKATHPDLAWDQG